jgi:hypothetical protein
VDAQTAICLVGVPPLGFLDHICKHCGTAAEVVGVNAEEERPAYKDDVSRCQVKLWMPRYEVAFVWWWYIRV